MNLRRAVASVALAAIALTATGVPTASGTEGPARPDASAPAPAARTALPVPQPRPGPETPRLASAPLHGLPTLQEARERGLIPAGASARGTGPSLAPGCGTPPQGWDYHDYLAPGECLTEGTYIAAHYGMSGTDNLWYELWLYKGELVLYFHLAVGGYAALWTTGTGGRGATAWMQTDGNFVIYDQDGRPLWALGTNGCGSQGAWLRVQRDANLVLYTRDWTPIWALNDGPSSRPC
jgi:hypothetical protein